LLSAIILIVIKQHTTNSTINQLVKMMHDNAVTLLIPIMMITAEVQP